MRRKVCLPLLLAAILAAGCSPGPDYKITLMQPLYVSNEEVPFVIRVMESDKAASGLDITAKTDMVKMAHGASQTDFQEGEDGIYSGKVKVPMAGTYKIELTIKNGVEEVEKTMEYNVKPAQ